MVTEFCSASSKFPAISWSSNKGPCTQRFIVSSTTGYYSPSGARATTIAAQSTTHSRLRADVTLNLKPNSGRACRNSSMHPSRHKSSRGGAKMTRLLARLNSLCALKLGRTQFESEMEAEIRFHLQSRTEDLIRSGLPPDQAARQARLEFGGIASIKQHARRRRAPLARRSMGRSRAMAPGSSRKVLLYRDRGCIVGAGDQCRHLPSFRMATRFSSLA